MQQREPTGWEGEGVSLLLASPPGVRGGPDRDVRTMRSIADGSEEIEPQSRGAGDAVPCRGARGVSPRPPSPFGGRGRDRRIGQQMRNGYADGGDGSERRSFDFAQDDRVGGSE